MQRMMELYKEPPSTPAPPVEQPRHHSATQPRGSSGRFEERVSTREAQSRNLTSETRKRQDTRYKEMYGAAHEKKRVWRERAKVGRQMLQATKSENEALALRLKEAEKAAAAGTARISSLAAQAVISKMRRPTTTYF